MSIPNAYNAWVFQDDMLRTYRSELKAPKYIVPEKRVSSDLKKLNTATPKYRSPQTDASNEIDGVVPTDISWEDPSEIAWIKDG